MAKKFNKNLPTRTWPSVVKWIKVWQIAGFRKLSEFQNQQLDIIGKKQLI